MTYISKDKDNNTGNKMNISKEEMQNIVKRSQNQDRPDFDKIKINEN